MGRTALALVGVLALGGCTAPNPAFEPFDGGRADRGAGGGGGAAGGGTGSGGARVDAMRALDAPGAAPGPSVRAPRVSCPADQDLLACFRFEGSAKDESPYARAVTASGALFASGPDGLALDNRSDTRVLIPNTTAFDARSVTVEAWVYPRTIPTEPSRETIVDYQRQFALFILPEGTVRCRVGNGEELRVSNAVRAGVWTSLACVASAAGVSIWINGTMRDSAPLQFFVPADSLGGLHIGTNFPQGMATEADSFDGLIDNLRIWRRVRSAQEICAAAIGCGP